MRRATRTAAQGSKAPARRPAPGEPHGVASHGGEAAGSEQRVARLTILIDPTKKRIFEEICAAQDLTPSQVVRRLIRQYVVENAGGRPLPEWLTGGAEQRAAERKKGAPAKKR
jgi:hypothetical protein